MYVREALRGKLRSALALGLAACLAGPAGIAIAAADAYSGASVSSPAPAQAADQNSLQPITGSWREVGASGERVLTIYSDGAYELVHKGGKAFGTVKVTAEEHPDGSKSLWYSFYEAGGLTLEDADTDDPWYSAFTSANELWAAFAKEEKAATQVELISGQDGALRFERNPEPGYCDTAEGIKAGDYVGIWGCGRCTAVVSKEGPGYLVEIQWANNAAEGSRWVYPCTYDSYSAILFSNDNGTRSDYICSEDGKETSDMIYNDGRSTFILRDGTLTWINVREPDARNVEFTQTPQ